MDLPAQLPIAVIGAGQAGLSAAYHLARRGLTGADFVVLDANEGPGGAWRHRWDSLTFGKAHDLHPLPGLPLETPDPAEPSSRVVIRYYGEYERTFGLPIRRPVKVTSVSAPGESGPLSLALAGPDGEQAALLADHVISATGTWDSPYWPSYPGAQSFAGRQLHTRDFRAAADFAGQRVVVVGAGTSAVQFLLQLEEVGALTTWVTRREVQWQYGRTNDAEWGRDIEERVNAKTAQGLLPGSVVSNTGIPVTAEYDAGIKRGLLVSAGPMERVVPDGIVLSDGRHVAADVILWATGFRAHIRHLAPLGLREETGGIRTDGVHVLREPRLSLVGYGASASTLGASRAGRRAALAASAAIGR